MREHMNKGAYADFLERLSLLIKKQPQLITTTLSNIFTMRLIGNKTHGDLAEIAIAEFVNQYMYNFKSYPCWQGSIQGEIYGWINYSHNIILVNLFSHALVSSECGHKAALKEIKQDILQLKRENNIDA